MYVTRLLTVRLILTFFGLWLWATAASATVLQPDARRVDLSTEVSLLEDRGGHLTVQDLARPEVAKRFAPWDATRGDVNLGFSPSAWWVRVRLKRTADAPRGWILDIPYAYNKYLDFYAPSVEPVLTGHARPVHSRPIFSRHFAFPVQVSDTAQDYYLRVESHYAVSLPMVLWQTSAYAESTLKGLLTEFLYYGALLALVIYNAFLCLSLRDARFGHYALFGLFLNAGMFAANGLGGVYLWESWRTFDEVSSGVFYGLAGTSYMAFARSFLQTRQAWPMANRVLQAMGVVYAVMVLLYVVMMGNAVWMTYLFQTLLVMSPLTIAVVWVTMLRKSIWNKPGVGYFALAWSFLALGTMVTVLRAFDWVPTNGLTSYASQIGSAFEMMLFSFALAAVVRDEREQRIQAQADMLHVKEEVIDLLKEGEQRLESAVKERTQALNQALRREQGTLAQYLRFTSLVSHEFRNRLNVISGQSDMLRKELPVPAAQERTEVIQRSVNHLANLTDRWLEGDRLLNSEITPSASNMALLPWLQQFLERAPQYREWHRVNLKVAPDANHVFADAELLDIALGNLLDNACKYAPRGSEVTILSLHDQGMTGVAVQDDGPGIPLAEQEQVFEAYYRVAPEGAVSGTGLGLNFVRRIAEAHGGKVALSSVPGQGSRFVIWFPDVSDESA